MTEKGRTFWDYPWHFEAALERLYSGEPRGALAFLDEGVARYPENAELYWLRGIAHEVAGENIKALLDLALCSRLAGGRKRHVRRDVCRVIKKLIDEGVDASWAGVLGAYGLYLEGDVEAALRTAKQARLGWLGDYLAGIYCRAAGRKDEAKEYLSRVMKETDIADTEVRRKVMHLLAEKEKNAKKKENQDRTAAHKLRRGGKDIRDTAESPDDDAGHRCPSRQV